MVVPEKCPYSAHDGGRMLGLKKESLRKVNIQFIRKQEGGISKTLRTVSARGVYHSLEISGNHCEKSEIS